MVSALGADQVVRGSGLPFGDGRHLDVAGCSGFYSSAQEACSVHGGDTGFRIIEDLCDRLSVDGSEGFLIDGVRGETCRIFPFKDFDLSFRATARRSERAFAATSHRLPRRRIGASSRRAAAVV
jgi:hypothetical protein